MLASSNRPHLTPIGSRISCRQESWHSAPAGSRGPTKRHQLFKFSSGMAMPAPFHAARGTRHNNAGGLERLGGGIKRQDGTSGLVASARRWRVYGRRLWQTLFRPGSVRLLDTLFLIRQRVAQVASGWEENLCHNYPDKADLQRRNDVNHFAR